MDYFSLKKKAIMGSMQSGKVSEVEGYPLKLENAIKGNMKDYRIWGNKKGKNYLDISKIVPTPDSTANVVVTEVDTSTGSVYINTVEGYTANGYYNTAKSLKSLAPHLEVGKIYCLNGTTQSSQRFIYLFSSKYYWYFGTNKTITEKDLASNIIIFGLAQNKGDGTGICKIEGLSITEEASTEYEPYQENDGLGAFGNIDVVTSGKNLANYEPYREPITTTIDLTGHNSIMPNDYIDFKNQVIVRSDGTEEDIVLPKIPLHKGYNVLTASDTELEATKMYGKYLKKG